MRFLFVLDACDLMVAAVEHRFGTTKVPQPVEGLSEAFVKTLKRDYASITVLSDAATILALLPDWIEDYCEVHPHSGLKFRSPREFIRLSA